MSRIPATRTSVILPAAGKGTRFGSSGNKVFADLAGKPILAHTIAAFESCDFVEEIIVVAGLDDLGMVRAVVSKFGFKKVTAVVEGGDQRQDSVRNGLSHANCEIVAIHDAARPFVTRGLILETVLCAQQDGACIAAVPVIDTIKRVNPDRRVTDTPTRDGLWAVQTPQTFRAELIRRAYDDAYNAGVWATDDSALVERIGVEVKVVRGDYTNIKITTPADMLVANAAAGSGEVRTGLGYDVHRLVEGRKLILGGVEIPFERGLLGHSDADVLTHAVCDALLGAAGLGDIGKLYPDTDGKYLGVSSLELLADVAVRVREAGWDVLNVDVVLIAERPKIAPYSAQMAANISERIGIGADRVSIKGTTTEGLGFTGRGEGIACQAVATVRRT